MHFILRSQTPWQVIDAASEHLKASGVTVKPYEAVLDEVRALAGAGKKLWVDPAQARRVWAPAPLPRH